ncbi:uncharacterized protein SOCE26_010860 [Sorangium cellulosum]|uniref:Secreted protein n=1 Tax=Sorangium cellulosum TaxID=56 RepID=A0A2L0EK70_SORCE|nr:DUF6345 domain-containing protein [Sorangium cellulosum]AUX39691.1 uncharacterized protein SOCE26_010860 [Sorangium cellulosum]
MSKHRLGFFAALFTALAAAPAAHAAYFEDGTWSTTDDDSWTREYYGDGVNDWSGTGNSNLAFCNAGVENIADQLFTQGYAYRFSTDADAWETDFTVGGQENDYGDAADYAYISTHGSPDLVAFNGSAGDDELTASETYWNLDLDVIALDACRVLEIWSGARTSYGNRHLNAGLHYVMGFDSDANDIITTAENYAFYLTQGYTHRGAWRQATSDGHESDRGGAYIRYSSSSCDTLNETLTSHACDPVWNSTYVDVGWTL